MKKGSLIVAENLANLRFFDDFRRFIQKRRIFGEFLCSAEKFNAFSTLILRRHFFVPLTAIKTWYSFFLVRNHSEMARKTPLSWYTLAKDLIDASTPTKFKAEFAGLDCYDMSHFWNFYMANTGFNRKDLLWTTDFCANYMKSMTLHANKWDTSDDNFRETVFDVLEHLEQELNELKPLLKIPPCPC